MWNLKLNPWTFCTLLPRNSLLFLERWRHLLSTCGRQNNDPRRHPRPTSLNLGNAVKGMLADAVVGNTERETGQKRVRQVPQETSAPGEGLHPPVLLAKMENESTSQEMRGPLKARGLPWRLSGQRAHLQCRRPKRRVRSRGGEDPPQKEMATRSSTVAWKIPCTEEPGGLQSKGWQRVGHGWAHTLLARGGKDKEAVSPLEPPERATGRPAPDLRPAEVRGHELAVYTTGFAVVCCRINGKLPVDFVVLRVGHLENDGSLGYVQSFPMPTCFLTQSQRAAVINITLCQKTLQLLGSFPVLRAAIHNFHLKTLTLPLATSVVSCFPWSHRFTSCASEKCLPNTELWTASLSLGGSCRK